jgi:Family of unknown function (DUF5367)
MKTQLFLAGFVIWALATVVLRVAGQYVLPGHWAETVLLFVISFPLMALLVRGLCRRFQLPREQWLAGAVSITMPTLLLDPFSSAFFPVVFPNIAPEFAGTFGGWMLCCCAGGLTGVLIRGAKSS